MFDFLSSQFYSSHIMAYMGQNQTSTPINTHIQQDYVSYAQFWQMVADKVVMLKQQPQQHYALWCQNSLTFFAWLWAGILADKILTLLPHRQIQLEQNLKKQGIDFIDDNTPYHQQAQNIEQVIQSYHIDWQTQLNAPHILFYTSGSTGQAKQIPRCLAQLFLEAQIIHQYIHFPQPFIMWATVSHQHLYGLTFQLCVPFVALQTFYAQQLIYPEQIEQQLTHYSNHQQALYHNILISSPALLKRCAGVFDFKSATWLLSAGGRLDTGVRTHYTQGILEIFGSSETGVIGYRYDDNALWQNFDEVALKLSDEQTLCIQSPYAYQKDWIITRDCVQLYDNGFELLGRSDRIVKLEEKRLSLDSIEYQLNQLDEVSDCHALLIEHDIEQQTSRTFLSVVVALTPTAWQQLKHHGKRAMVQQLKRQLQAHLEPIAIAKHWRFVTYLPRNTQSKLSQLWVKQLFLSAQYPHVLAQSQQEHTHIFKLQFSPELLCFKGHFDGFPIYPGVGQLAFFIHFAQQTWTDLQICCGYEQVKFQQLIRPYDVLDLYLTRTQHKISFQLKSDEQIIASGRLLFNLTE